MQQIVVFSHGYGVRADSGGLFSDIASGLGTNVIPVTFDYGDVDETSQTITLPPLSEQASRLNTVVKQAQNDHPGLPITLIGHSQGSVVVGLAQPQNVERVILMAPAWQFGPEVTEVFKQRHGVKQLPDGRMSMPQDDGYTLVIGPEYKRQLDELRPLELYNQLAEQVPTSIIWAKNDGLIVPPPSGRLSASIAQETLPGNHGFAGEARKSLIKSLIAKLNS